MSELGDGEVKPQTAFRKPIQLFFQPSSYFPLSPSLTQTVKLKRLLQAKRHSLPDSCSERPSIRRLGRRRQNNGLLWQVFVAVLPPLIKLFKPHYSEPTINTTPPTPGHLSLIVGRVQKRTRTRTMMNVAEPATVVEKSVTGSDRKSTPEVRARLPVFALS